MKSPRLVASKVTVVVDAVSGQEEVSMFSPYIRYAEGQALGPIAICDERNELLFFFSY